jgi:quercetin dioxygenase-like cupin family protein
MGRIRRYTGDERVMRWDGVAVEGYGDAALRDVTKQVLIGPKDGAAAFAVRYFEVAPGGRTSLDDHLHDHGVVILRGRGRVRLGDEEHDIGFGDVVYVASHEIHQFFNVGDEPLGFLCVVPPRPPK